MIYELDNRQLMRLWSVLSSFGEIRETKDPIVQSEILSGEPSNRDGMRRRKRPFSSELPKCMTAQRSAGMLKLLVAEVMVMVRAAISGCSDANGICMLPG